MASLPLRPAPGRPAAAGSVVDDLVSDFLTEQSTAKAAEAEAALRRRKRRIPLAVGLGVVCAAAWLVPLPAPGGDAAPPPHTYAVASARVELGLAAGRVRAFREQHRRLPETAALAGILDPGILYQRTSEGEFVLRTVVGETLLTWDSNVAPEILSEDIQSVLNHTGR